MFTKNYFENGTKSIEGALALFTPAAIREKNQMNVDAQHGQTFIQNVDHALPKVYSTNKGLAYSSVNQAQLNKYNASVDSASMVDYTKRKKGTFDGIDINFGFKLVDSIEVFEEVASRGFITSSMESYRYYSQLIPEAKKYLATGQISSNMVALANNFKISFLEDLYEVKRVFYAQDKNAYETTLMDTIETYQDLVTPLVSVVMMDGNEAKSYLHGIIEQTSKNLYGETIVASPYETSNTSTLAKDKLLKNPWYLSYIENMKTSSPELYKQVQLAANSPTITEIEKKIVESIMRNYDQLYDQRQKLIDEFGWDTMEKVFGAKQSSGGSLQDLLDMQWSLKSTAIDDEIEKSIAGVNAITYNFDNYFDSTIDSDPITSYNINNIMSGKAVDSGDNSEQQFEFPSTTSDNMRYDPLTKKIVPVDYENDKRLPRLLGKGFAFSQEEWDKIEEQRYKTIKDKNISQLINGNTTNTN